MVETYSLKKDGQKRLQPNFCVEEMRSKCGADEILIDSVLMEKLQILRDSMGLDKLVIVSGYRTQAYNDSLPNSAKNSQHLLGKAADVCAYKNGEQLHPKYLCCAAEVLGMNGIGVMQTCAHLDTRDYQAWFDENYSHTRIESFGHKSWFTYFGVDNLDFMENPFTLRQTAEVLQKGSMGEEVRYVQFELVKRGYLDLIAPDGTCNIDGAYGDRTERAYNKYCEDCEKGGDDFDEIAEKEYKLEEVVLTMSFGGALEALKSGKKVAREGWNGKGMFLFLAKDIEITTDADLSCVADLEGELTLPSIVMKTADNHFCVGWLASQTDMLAEDWIIVE